MLTIRLYKKFKRDYKRIQKSGYDISLLDEVIQMLAEGKALPAIQSLELGTESLDV